MASMMEMAKDLGQAMARTDEYKALNRALESADDDRELTELRNELEKLERSIQTSLRSGEQPDEETREAYESAVSKLQSNSTYQRLAAAQANFDKIVQKVNETITEGIREGASSRIVLPS